MPASPAINGNARSSASFTRPADTTAYASGDLVANNTTAGSVTPMQFPIKWPNSFFEVEQCRILKSSNVVLNASFRLHLFASAPTVINGDNGVFTPTLLTDYIGALDVTIDIAGNTQSVGVGTPKTGAGTELSGKLDSGNVLFGLLEARGAYTPASAEVFTVTLDIEQD